MVTVIAIKNVSMCLFSLTKSGKRTRSLYCLDNRKLVMCEAYHVIITRQISKLLGKPVVGIPEFGCRLVLASQRPLSKPLYIC